MPVAATHPWSGLKIGYLGDSITDPRNGGGKITKYWQFLQEWLGITPYVYGISGRQWNDIPRQAERLKAEHPDIDGILVFIGTNDFNAGIPIGHWFTQQEETVYAARGREKGMVSRMHRTPVLSDSTFCGRINRGILRLKQLFGDKQIILLTPLHRGLFNRSESNVQPDENYQNRCGEYVDAYVQAIKEAGNIWSIPVIDLNAIAGIQPMVDEQKFYFNDSQTDLLHPGSDGHRRIARTLMQWLLLFPPL
ncbi:MAG: SGNH/GDSL hydrolase family protein [Prevotellaceae bacterium]|nr:SGNH/GDSL hydrolase family protein [Prevotellaceae bacterium]